MRFRLTSRAIRVITLIAVLVIVQGVVAKAMADGQFLSQPGNFGISGLLRMPTESHFDSPDLNNTALNRKADIINVRLNHDTRNQPPIACTYAFDENVAVGGYLNVAMNRFNDPDVVIAGAAPSLYNLGKVPSDVGVDLGMAARMQNFQIGIAARNFNTAPFPGIITEGFPIDRGESSAQVTAGAAFIPVENFRIKLDMDLTPEESAPDRQETRNLGVGVEWEAWRFASIRAGTFKNLAEKDMGWAYSAGLGIRLWAVHLDMAAEFINQRERIEQVDPAPKEIRAALQLNVNF